MFIYCFNCYHSAGRPNSKKKRKKDKKTLDEKNSNARFFTLLHQICHLLFRIEGVVVNMAGKKWDKVDSCAILKIIVSKEGQMRKKR